MIKIWRLRTYYST